MLDESVIGTGDWFADDVLLEELPRVTAPIR
jgi:hypothetical protein